MDREVLNIQEGPASNYIEALHQKFGGQRTSNTYSINIASIACHLTTYEIHKGLELVVTEGLYNKILEARHIPDDYPDYIHINIFKEGQLTRHYSSKKEHVEAGTTKGVFAHNGMFPLVAEFPANHSFKSIGFKFHKDALMELMPEAMETYEALFGDHKPITYHASLPKEIERITDDIFYFRECDFGNRSLVMARGLEAFTALWMMAKNQNANNDLNGLHVDDYKRLLQIKEKLLGSFDQKIVIEDIALEYGISASKLKRDFKSLYDCSIYQFYTHAKMDEAYRRLKSGEYSVMEVGYDLGYQNLSKFSSMFKKVKGISPKDVLKMPA
ncbi:helix-turn-helix domain-containing protein [Carboxylicivirga sp. RSCT41]|uniref:helix-turn-helix domain-containing protein n=1 Tax=Carboxylicivirga agarovorans TaxID=3417570 RepID=UPI003D3398D9